MPNWAWGTVETTGTKSAILAFSKRFIADDDELNGARFFARSFLNLNRSIVKEEIDNCFKDVPENEERAFPFYVDFAWSAYGCLIEGYPDYDKERCLTLSEACAEDGVDVVLWTKEPGMCFEESIVCTRDGDLDCESKALRTARCRNCGYTESIASFEDLDDMECTECGSTDFEWEE